MNILYFIFILVIELAFIIASVRRKPSREDWQLARVITDAGELLLLLVMMLLPDISFGIRFNGLISLLVIRLIIAGVRYCWLKVRKEKRKGIAAMIGNLLFSLILILIGLIPSFVFADYKGLPVTGDYKVAMTHAILIDEDRVESYEQDGSKRELPVYFYYPDDAKEGETFPVVFFSHGAFGYYQSNTSTYMELASHGYVIISMEHPYHSLFTKDSAGKLIIADRNFLSGVMTANSDKMTEKEIFNVSRDWINLRMEDANFAVDLVKQSVESNQLNGEWFVAEKDEDAVKHVVSMMDTKTMGFMGHSLGGAAAVGLGRCRDDMDAVVDIDGTMLSEIHGVESEINIINEDAYEVPLLSFENTEAYEESKAMEEAGIPYANNIVLAHAREGFCTTIEGTGHMNYTDLPMFAPVLADLLGTGEVDPEGCMRKVNEIILEFFDCYLKDAGTFSVESSYQIN